MSKLSAIVALSLAGSAQAVRQQQTAFIYHPQTAAGVTMVCADVNDQGLGNAELWVTGFVSGMNAATYSSVGETTTTNGLLGEVKLYCTQHPSANLMNATYATYERMKAARK